MKLIYKALLLSVMIIPAYSQDNNTCEAVGENLDIAKNNYALACLDIPRTDCDPDNYYGIGYWRCSSGTIGTHSPSTNNVVTDPAPTIELPEDSSSECVAVGDSLDNAIIAYEASCMAPRVDCDPNGEFWSCSSGVIGNHAPSISLVTPTEPTEPTVPVEPSEPVTEITTPTTPTNTYTGPVPNRAWLDSYSVNGFCYPSTGGDHGILNKLVTGPDGVTRTVREALPLLIDAPGLSTATAVYNDIQCGNGPPNDNGDEDPDQCPGRVDMGREGCQIIGPLWQYK